VPYGGPVIHVKGGSVFHHPACVHLRGSLSRNQTKIDSEAVATAQGLSACNLYLLMTGTPAEAEGRDASPK
jgi:hypothetical protein